MCSGRIRTSAAEGSGAGLGDMGCKGRLGLAQEFRGKKSARSPTGAGEPPAGHKRGVT